MWEKVDLYLGIYYPPFSAILKFPPEVDNKSHFLKELASLGPWSKYQLNYAVLNTLGPLYFGQN